MGNSPCRRLFLSGKSYSKEHFMYTYKTNGTCSRAIHFDIVNGKLHHVTFDGGCPGNLQGISRLVEGMKATDVIARLDGIKCGNKPTSCPDQFAKALKEALAKS